MSGAALGGGLRFAGYAALFDRPDAMRDIIRRGAFTRSLAERADPMPLCWQHDADKQIGWIDQIAEDERGLRVVGVLSNGEGGAARALRRGAVTGLSFGYFARRFHRGELGRELTDVDVFEVSLVSRPMQHTARVHLIAQLRGFSIFPANLKGITSWIL